MSKENTWVKRFRTSCEYLKKRYETQKLKLDPTDPDYWQKLNVLHKCWCDATCAMIVGLEHKPVDPKDLLKIAAEIFSKPLA